MPCPFRLEANDDPWLRLGESDHVLALGAQVTVPIGFFPERVAQYEGMIRIVHSTGRLLSECGVVGQGGVYSLEAATTADVGLVAIHSKRMAMFDVANTGHLPFSWTVEGGVGEPSCGDLDPGLSTRAAVVCLSQQLGAWELAVMVVAHSDGVEVARQAVSVRGEGYESHLVLDVSDDAELPHVLLGERVSTCRAVSNTSSDALSFAARVVSVADVLARRATHASPWAHCWTVSPAQGVLAAGQTCELHVTFTPDSGVSEQEPHEAAVLVEDSQGLHSAWFIVRGFLGHAVLECATPAIDLGVCQIGVKRLFSIELGNSGTAKLSAVVQCSAPLSTEQPVLRLNAGAQGLVQVAVVPGPGPVVSHISVTSEGGSTSVAVTVQGGEFCSDLSRIPKKLSFLDVRLGQSATCTFVFGNAGSLPYPVLIESDEFLSVTAESSIAPHSSVDVHVSFQVPVETDADGVILPHSWKHLGVAEKMLRLTLAEGGVHDIPVVCSTVHPPLELDASVLDFGELLMVWLQRLTRWMGCSLPAWLQLFWRCSGWHEV